MDKLDYCFHSHTKRCGHAYGEDIEFAEAAIKGGYKTLGYSDHVMLPNIVQPRMRGTYSMLPDYVQSVRSLQRKFAKTIQILLAFECEWYGDLYKDYYQSLYKKEGFDYLILGQHNVIDNGQPIFYGDLPDREVALRRYRNDIIAGMESGLFLYVAHPDLFMIWYHDWDALAMEVADEIIAKAKELNLPLEVNMGPSRWASRGFDENGELEVPYPDPRFWDKVSASNVDVVIGVDSHLPNELLTSNFNWVFSFIERHHLHLLDRENILNRLFHK